MFYKLAATIAVASVASASVSRTLRVGRVSGLKGLAVEQDEVGLAVYATTFPFVKYFDYEGTLAVGGSVDLVRGDDVYVTLSGLDPKCSAGAGDAANSCGIHLHAGTDCTTDAGGHYWVEVGPVIADPWTPVNYDTDYYNEFTGSGTVVTGYSPTELIGHAVIVHDYTGARVACALLEEIGVSPVQQSSEGFLQTNFVQYFNYNGLLDTKGYVHVATTGVTQEVTATLTGFDESCADGPSDAANSCGLHIHAGTSCDSDAGGHYFNSAMLWGEDPWVNIVAFPDDVFTRFSVVVTTGLAAEDITGHVFIVHDRTGARVACSILEDPTQLPIVSQATTSPFVKYFDYYGTLAVGGSVDQVSGDDFYVTLSGLDPKCSAGPGDAANSCGIHLHQGRDCTTDAREHYYGKGRGTTPVYADPWTDVAYYSDSADKFTGYGRVVTGYARFELTGHAFIVHDYTGARVACALLEEIGVSPVQQSSDMSGFVHYFNYNGPLDTKGDVHVSTTGVTQEVIGTFTDIDERCADGPSDAANSCGLHIHVGTSCDSDAGGHYFNSAMLLGEDPWVNIVAFPDDVFTGYANIVVTTGYAAEDITGHVFIVHDYNGVRVACSILVEPTPCEGTCGDNTKCEQDECVPECGVTNNCCVGDGNCDDAYMRTCVGSFDPVCERELWDTQCADEAQMNCGLTC